MQWLKLMGAVPLAVAIAACSSNRARSDSATSAGVLSDSLGYGIDTNPPVKPGMTMDSMRVSDSLKLKADSAWRDSVVNDSVRKTRQPGKKSQRQSPLIQDW
jgi:hypothetical protein